MEGTLLNSFYGTKVTLIPKAVKDIVRKKIIEQSPKEHRCGNSP